LMSLVGFEYVLEATQRVPTLYSVRTGALVRRLLNPADLPVLLARHAWIALMYLGLFSLPLLPTAAAALRRPVPRAVLVWIGPLLFLGVSVFRLVSTPSLMPVGINILVAQGIGPLSLRSAAVPALPRGFWLTVTGLSILGAMVLLSNAVRFGLDLIVRIRRGDAEYRDVVMTFFVLSTCAYLAPLLPIFSFDRYFVPPMVFVIGFLGAQVGRLNRAQCATAYLVIACFGVFAVAGTRDYLEWNRLRWRALATLLERQVTPSDIDGGFEFNGWHLYNERYVRMPGKSSWWVVDDEYVVALSPLQGYETISRHPYQHWMPTYEGNVLVLQRRAKVASRASPAPD
jgi:hypothetical protein